ncbi:MAG: FAD-binding protein, partial [Bacteroidales bacterium]|nr:FAD-binding protein [Bacteroidales bacterium]
MIKEFNLRVEPQIAANEASLKHFICLEKGLKGQSVKAIQVIKRSIDARQRKVFFQMQVRVFINEL